MGFFFIKYDFPCVEHNPLYSICGGGQEMTESKQDAVSTETNQDTALANEMTKRIKEPIIITDFVSANMKHPGAYTIHQLNEARTTHQVIAKHSVTNQQLGNALSILAYITDNLNQGRWSGRKPRFSTREYWVTINLNPAAKVSWCATCKTLYNNSKRFTIWKQDNDTEPPVTVSRMEIHNAMIHGLAIEDSLCIVRYLGLQPNTCYARVNEYITKWRETTSMPGHLDMANQKAILKASGYKLLYTYNKNGVAAMVYDSNVNRFLRIEIDEPLQEIVVEQASVKPRSGPEVTIYKLGWTPILSPQDWFCKP